jgi:hypothetical protein
MCSTEITTANLTVYFLHILWLFKYAFIWAVNDTIGLIKEINILNTTFVHFQQIILLRQHVSTELFNIQALITTECEVIQLHPIY